MNQPKLTIPKPCHENWEGMTPEDKGRFCGMCQKTVVDFTAMVPDEIGQFFEEHRGQKICGRFRDDQLAQPEKPLLPPALVNRITRQPLGFRQMFMVALLVCMGSSLFSCKQTQGELDIVSPEAVDTITYVTDSVNREVTNSNVSISPNDTVLPPPTLMGDVAVDPPPQVQQPTKQSKFRVLTGAVAVEPQPETSSERKEKTTHIQGDTIVSPQP